ncbi:hypothetical protein B7486_36845 [cyanobacterium TDX16]|nr:hypothetical protein B7486_36845 [cyanobacterium TDX16]
MKLLIAAIAILCIVGISALNWRGSVKTVFFILVIEGALRKWVLPQASDAIYFLKDLVLLGAYLQYFVFSSRRFSIQNRTISILIIFASVWCVLQIFNPSLGSPLVGIFGLRGYIFYIPLMWMLPTLFRSEQDLYKFLHFHLLLVIPIGLLGIAQFFSPTNSPINVYAPSQLKEVATFGVAGATQFARVTGTFSFIDGYAVYLLICFGLLIALLSLQQPPFWKWVSIFELSLVTINSCMTGSRSVVFALLLFFFSFITVKGFTQPEKNISLLGKFLLPAICISLVSFIWFKPAINAFLLRTNSNQDVTARITATFTQPFEFIQYKGLDGYGTGATQPGGQTLRRLLNLPDGAVIPTYYEEEPGRIVLELGPIGFFLWYGLRLSILIEIWLVFCKLKKPFLRQLALTALLIQTIGIYDQLVTQPTFLAYYWFFSGFIFLLPRLESIESWYREQQLLQQHNVSSTYLPDSPYQ